MALKLDTLKRAESMLRRVNDLDKKITDFAVKDTGVTAFDVHEEKKLSAVNGLRVVPMKGSLPTSLQSMTTRERVLNHMALTNSMKKKTTVEPEEKYRRRKKKVVDLEQSSDEDISDDEFDENDPFFAQDDEIEYESDCSDDDDDSDVSTTREDSLSSESSCEESSEDAEDTEELEDELYRLDEEHINDDRDDAGDTYSDDTIARQSIRRWFQLLDCSVSSKFKDVFMALIDAILLEDGVSFDNSTIKYTDAMLAAYRLYNEGVVKPSGKVTVSACFLWLHAKTELMYTLVTKYQASNPAFCEWIHCIAKDSYADDAPMSAVSSTQRTCFYSGKSCRTGFTVVHCMTKEPLSTLWYCSDDEDVCFWVHGLVRFLFLPHYIRRWCITNHITLTTYDERHAIVEFAMQSIEMFSDFLVSAGFEKAKYGSIQWPELVKKKIK